MTASQEANRLDQAFAPQASRYIVGIDLGTTNCAVSFVDTQQSKQAVQIFRIEQMVDASTWEASDTLPSFHYEMLPNEDASVEHRFLFQNREHTSVVGIMARQRSMELPGRSIASAKSWLCHKMVDRESDLLPWGGDEDILTISPVEASRRYLEHIRRCWDRVHPGYPLKEQDTIVTLPASFDEIARRLTIEAARRAGIEKLSLIEEPQAAFYAWLQRNSESWTKHLRLGQTILVCDIGGGTTDFTLIRVIPSSRAETSIEKQALTDIDASQDVAGELEASYGLHRVAVGDHLMLGGDNLDIALARAIEQTICNETGQNKLKPRQWDALKSQCRAAKERFLSATPPEEISISLPSGSSRLIEGLRTVPVRREWAHQLLIEGFFGSVPLNAHPLSQPEGFQEFGLPYATEANVLKHLAAFLWNHRSAGRAESELSKTDIELARPDWVLFNGGVLESPQVKDAILQQIADWFSTSEQSWRPGVLEGNRLDLAVAQGAAYFGLVRRGEGVKIDATLAKAYYFQINQEPGEAICVMPAKAHPGERFSLPERVFELTIGEPVRFQPFSSNTKLTDQPGDIMALDEGTMTRLPALQTILQVPNRKGRSRVPVVIETELSEIGTLQTRLISSSSYSDEEPLSWQLEFEARSAGANISNAKSGGSRDGTMGHVADVQALKRASDAVKEMCDPNAKLLPKDAVSFLSERLEAKRQDWEPTVLRELWRSLLEHSDYRKRSASHESRWMNLLGWCLRPGFGCPGDEWRVGETWRSVHNKIVHRTPENISETVVLWRRISGGFTPGQQKALFQDVWPRVRGALGGGSGLNTNVMTELLRLIGSLEWLDIHDKVTVGHALLDGIGKKKNAPIVDSLFWTLGRMGSRSLTYANFQSVVPSHQIHKWIERVLALDERQIGSSLSQLSLCLVLWARPTGDRYRDLDESVRKRVLDWMESHHASLDHCEMIKTGRRFNQEEANAVFGESLPLGFTLLH